MMSLNFGGNSPHFPWKNRGVSGARCGLAPGKQPGSFLFVEHYIFLLLFSHGDP